VGVPGEDAALAAMAAAHGVSLHPDATSEGYSLLIQPQVVILLGNSAVGVFYGVQSMLQLLSGGSVAPACRVDDWPDFPIRGALMSEMTEMNQLRFVDVPCWDRTPPHTSGGFCAHFNYTLQLVDWMVEHKMNYGIPDVPWLGTDSYYNVVPGINPNATQAAWIEARLRELQAYMEERHVQFVPNVHSPDGNSLFDARMVEGTWVRNASFTFDRAAEVAAPTAASTLAEQLNGDFAELGADGRHRARSHCRFAPPLVHKPTIFANVFGASVSESTMRPDHRSASWLGVHQQHAGHETVDCRLNLSAVEQHVRALAALRDGVGGVLAQERRAVGEQQGRSEGPIPRSLPR
jgi:hypothetical protein